MLALMFPGQGSQKVGMGGRLFETYPEWTELADRILDYSIQELCLEDPHRLLDQTQYTQPALFVVNALTHLDREKVLGRPDFVLGHSLGEYNALLTAGVFDFVTGLKLVRKRGELMARSAGGGMAAVIGFPHEDIVAFLSRHNLANLDVANVNSRNQCVIAGPLEDIDRAQGVFEQEGVQAFWKLNVSAAFHSRYMEDACKEFSDFLEDFHFSVPSLPVISNTEAKPYTADHVRKLLAEQIAKPVLWQDSIRYAMGRGATRFEEIGHGTVLTGLLRQITKQSHVGDRLFRSRQG